MRRLIDCKEERMALDREGDIKTNESGQKEKQRQLRGMKNATRKTAAKVPRKGGRKKGRGGGRGR